MLEIGLETFAGTFPCAPHYMDLGHFRMHYVDEGAGEPLVLLHGAQFCTLPVLLVWGMQDPVLPPAVLRMWQALYPHAVTCEIAVASHFVQEDAPQRVLQALERSLPAYP